MPHDRQSGNTPGGIRMVLADTKNLLNQRNAKYLFYRYGKNNFIEISKNLLDTDLKIILLDH